MPNRVLLAFAVAPALIPLGIVGLMIAQGMKLTDDTIVIPAIYAAFTYGAALLFGLPLYWFFSRRRWTAWWQYAAAGAAIGTAILLPFAIQRPFDTDPETWLLFAGLGLVSTTLFWIVGIRESKSART